MRDLAYPGVNSMKSWEASWTSCSSSYRSGETWGSHQAEFRKKGRPEGRALLCGRNLVWSVARNGASTETGAMVDTAIGAPIGTAGGALKITIWCHGRRGVRCPIRHGNGRTHRGLSRHGAGEWHLGWCGSGRPGPR
jgi:hypothetical protein